uniref:hypothetical protein n=1 Tax=Paractinoplanes polyasparticus TaxID=2856853 RepID=UPI001C857C31|nr:hypothetical protein [Actinoplanes polyasparticus]
MPNNLPTRTEPFLALTDEGDRLRDAVIEETMRLQREAFGGSRPDWAALARFQNPKVGELVLELTRSAYSKDARVRRIGFGYLVYADGENYQVQYGADPEDVCDWANCRFTRVPAEALAVLA